MGTLTEEFWAGKRVFVTGHTGFKGSWLTVLLDHLGAEVTGFSLPTVDDPSLFSAAGVRGVCRDLRGDVRDLPALCGAIEAAQPQIVVHLAAQAIVARGFADPCGTLSHNVLGTAVLLEAVRRCESTTAVVVATTDKVYRNRGPGNRYGEADPLGGNEPYGVSKACAELVTECYRDAYLSPVGIRVASARAGNVVGGGDWGESRLVPDIVRAWHAGEPVVVRNPRHVRPWQYVLDVLTGYLTLAERLSRGEAPEGPYNFGPRADDTAVDVASVVALAQALYPAGRAVLGGGEDVSREAAWLRIDASKARRELGFANRFGVGEAIRETFRWYRLVHEGQQPLKVCRDMIRAYESGETA
ncbi:CDP-glucose 4,6-dehydratase [Streptomyces sp. JHA26]|uniref:CDP-glucose 4,6-dehydratase n=1 Tax=Streptomyces sp. JHA26 TaxID=1917143 RepID=UPI00098B4C09|nr:CDP-glucose 4,6-dehydratase [Streptomyces sp. JHA26]